MTGARLARAAAILIALAAVLDPPWTRNQIVPVPIAVMHDGQSTAFASRLRAALAGEFALTEGASPGSQATILLRARDERLPPVPEHGPVFIVDDPDRTPPIRIRALEAPRAALAGRAINVRVAVDAVDTLAAPLRIELRADGDLVGRAEHEAGRRGRIDATLTFVPAAAGLIPLEIIATSGDQTTRAGTAVRVENRKLRVAFVDPRPSWSSTFVRRALEEDAAFEITSATTVSRGVAVTLGTAAPALDAAGREAIDVIVAGAPSALSATETAALESFARERGGAVVLLAETDSAAALTRLTGVTGWRPRAHAPAVTATGAHGSFAVSETLLPLAAPAASTALATAGTPPDPVVQEFAAGAGRVIVSGAVDAWRHRASAGSTFGQFWRGVIADAALAAAPPIGINTPRRVNPAETVQAEVVVRGARAGEAISIEGTVETAAKREALRFWPAPAPGVFTAHVSAPSRDGLARIAVTASAGGRTSSGETVFLVSAFEPLSNVPMGVPIVLMSARDGAYIADGNPDALRNDLRLAFPEHRAPVAAHPMRYAWWIVPFTLLLGYEWRWRRERGLK